MAVPKFVAGDRVRLGKARRTFHKGYLPAWTQELFTVHQRLPRVLPYVYKIRDDKGDIVQGTFYEPEMQKVEDTGVYKIEKILQRKRGQILVKWLGYSDEYNSWIAEAGLQNA